MTLGDVGVRALHVVTLDMRALVGEGAGIEGERVDPEPWQARGERIMTLMRDSRHAD